MDGCCFDSGKKGSTEMLLPMSLFLLFIFDEWGWRGDILFFCGGRASNQFDVILMRRHRLICISMNDFEKKVILEAFYMTLY